MKVFREHKWIIYLIIAFLPMCTIYAVDAGEPVVRLKDVGRIIEARHNQLLGYGLVVGLRNTGDSRNTMFTSKALTTMLANLGLSSDGKSY
ncbi:MAG: flagellar basal body P-ring protein FlgI, partial [Candidatus Margulisbacteria bacterium]|nr:flagellar basal body P-ring protein FlgI [Candidatus Margulisiibacteriota bacterium]